MYVCVFFNGMLLMLLSLLVGFCWFWFSIILLLRLFAFQWYVDDFAKLHFGGLLIFVFNGFRLSFVRQGYLAILLSFLVQFC